MNSPVLLVLAAGMGSRYGGLKQMDAVGPRGEWLLDYSVYDAYQAGFREVVFIIRESFAEAFCEEISKHLPKDLNWRTVNQKMSHLPNGLTPPPERVKPLGTGHAIACAESAIQAPFAVINADDYYGAEAFEVMGKWLQNCDPEKSEYAMVSYELSKTLSKHGHVSRGICNVVNSKLNGVQEKTHLYPVDGGAENRREGELPELFPANTPVSMNLWGFNPGIFKTLNQQLAEFLQNTKDPLKDEFYIPSAVDKILKEKSATVEVLQTSSYWFGITYAEDKSKVSAAIAEQYVNGTYPDPLWKNE